MILNNPIFRDTTKQNEDITEDLRQRIEFEETLQKEKELGIQINNEIDDLLK